LAKGKLFRENPAAAGVVQFSGGRGGDYRLSASSKYKGKGLDGKDIGADLDAIAALIAGVD